jgi:hypothetical protein
VWKRAGCRSLCISRAVPLIISRRGRMDVCFPMGDPRRAVAAWDKGVGSDLGGDVVLCWVVIAIQMDLVGGLADDGDRRGVPFSDSNIVTKADYSTGHNKRDGAWQIIRLGSTTALHRETRLSFHGPGPRPPATSLILHSTLSHY